MASVDARVSACNCASHCTWTITAYDVTHPTRATVRHRGSVAMNGVQGGVLEAYKARLHGVRGVTPALPDRFVEDSVDHYPTLSRQHEYGRLHGAQRIMSDATDVRLYY